MLLRSRSGALREDSDDACESKSMVAASWPVLSTPVFSILNSLLVSFPAVFDCVINRNPR